MQTGRDAIDVNRAIERKLPAGFSEGFFADVVVLVEGLTDKVIVEELIAKLGSAADRGGISVIDVSGKPELWICRGMLEALGVRVYTIADGDAGVAARKHPDNEDKQNNARASHATATKQFLDAHATLGAAELHGGLATDFDQPSCITDGWACWQDDIENELAAWPSFMEAIDNDASGKGLRSKDAAAYRSAASLAKAEDAPEIFGTLVTAIAGK
jgi:predicted ATP-dependent endonuclease of OLD family